MNTVFNINRIGNDAATERFSRIRRLNRPRIAWAVRVQRLVTEWDAGQGVGRHGLEATGGAENKTAKPVSGLVVGPGQRSAQGWGGTIGRAMPLALDSDQSADFEA